jgi:hypothetical protein
MTFTMEGTRDRRPVTLVWAEKSGFTVDDQPDNVTAWMVEHEEQVCSTVMGPCYAAAASPPVVAWITAVASMQTITSTDDPHGVEQLVIDDATVPDDAVS